MPPLPNSPDQWVAAFARDPGNAQLALRAGVELSRAGREEEAVAIWTLGDDLGPLVRSAKDEPSAPLPMRQDSQAADTAIRTFLSNLHREAIAELEEERGVDLERVSDAVWTMTHDSPVDFVTPMQRPVVFYMPGLDAAPVADKALLPWAATLEQAWREIRTEFLAAIEVPDTMRPYVPAGTPGDWQTLAGTLDWSAIYLFDRSQRTANADRFPKTLAALESAELVRVDGAPMEVFFSRLTPVAHIPPHYGLTNTRLTVHLPLIVPDNCAIRVGSQEHRWIEGEIVAFDDSFEHEAWNRSGEDRVVLIFETHHPDLSPDERAAIERAYSVRNAWLGRRRELLGISQARRSP